MASSRVIAAKLPRVELCRELHRGEESPPDTLYIVPKGLGYHTTCCLALRPCRGVPVFAFASPELFTIGHSQRGKAGLASISSHSVPYAKMQCGAAW